MYSETESYLEELMRPQDQVNFIKDVKTRYRVLEGYETEMKYLLGDPARYLFDEVIKFLAKMERMNYRNADSLDHQDIEMDIEDKWWDNQNYRKQIFRKHKMHIAAMLKNKMRGINKNLPKVSKIIDQYIKDQKELKILITNNKKIYNKIETRWYNIFGGPQRYIKNRGDWSTESVKNLMKYKKMSPAKIAADFLCMRFIMGVDRDPHSEVAKLLLGDGYSHRHFLTHY